MTLFKKDSVTSRTPSTSGSTASFSFFNRTPSSPKSEADKERDAPHSNSFSLPGLRDMFGVRASVAKDSRVSGARKRVQDALEAERLADKALSDARKKVHAAKEQSKQLEREAFEETKRAKAMQAEAKKVSKTAKGLGRYD